MLRRVRGHKIALAKGRHHNKYLQNAYAKYGDSSFAWEIIERCSSEGVLAEREQFWIEYHRSSEKEFGFNLAFPVRQRTPSPRMSEIFAAKWKSFTEEERETRNRNVSLTMKAQCQEPERKGRLTEISNEYWKLKSSRDKRREVSLHQWANDPELRARRSKKSKPTKVHTLFLKIGDVEKPIKLWAEQSGIPYGTLKERFNKKEKIETIFRPTRDYKATDAFVRWFESVQYGDTAAACGLSLC